MLIPLFDPIWSRLYGPYGVEDVAGPLEELSRRWDEDLARDLFWEKLHHQEDLYPVTFAALPWIWERSPDRLSDPAGETFPFSSYVLACATRTDGTGCDGTGPRGRFRGLSTRVEDHQWPWISPEQRLRAGDMKVLGRLEAWFARTAPVIAEASLAAISGQDRFLDAVFLNAVTTWRGAETFAEACSMWGGEHDMETILDEAPRPSEADRAILLDVGGLIEARAPDVALFVREWAAAAGEERT